MTPGILDKNNKKLYRGKFLIYMFIYVIISLIEVLISSFIGIFFLEADPSLSLT